jgi:hypothetical protein
MMWAEALAKQLKSGATVRKGPKPPKARLICRLRPDEHLLVLVAVLRYLLERRR